MLRSILLTTFLAISNASLLQRNLRATKALCTTTTAAPSISCQVEQDCKFILPPSHSNQSTIQINLIYSQTTQLNFSTTNHLTTPLFTLRIPQQPKKLIRSTQKIEPIQQIKNIHP